LSETLNLYEKEVISRELFSRGTMKIYREGVDAPSLLPQDVFKIDEGISMVSCCVCEFPGCLFIPAKE